jgi:hypothetical protein
MSTRNRAAAVAAVVSVLAIGASVPVASAQTTAMVPPGIGGAYPGFPGHEGGFPGHEGGYPGHEGGYPGHEGGYPGHEGGYPRFHR